MNLFNEPVRVKKPGPLLLLLFVLLLLVVLVFPVNSMMRSHAKQTWCASNLGQIANACEAYAANEPGTFPLPWATGAGRPKGHVQDAHQARLVTVRAMALLTLVCNESMQLFRCPESPFPAPHTKPSTAASDDQAWGASPDANVSYALDWACQQAGSDRVLVADRDPASHHRSIIVAYGDGHTKKLMIQPLADQPITTMRTEGSDGKPVPMTTATAPNDFYAPAAGSVQAQLTQDGGDPHDAWVK